MRNLQNRIQQMLSDRKRNSQVIALFVAFSMIISFVVPYLSIVPGVAMTNGATPDSSLYPDALEIKKENISKLFVTSSSGDDVFYNNGDYVSPSTINGNSISLDFELEYEFNSGEGKGFDAYSNKKYMYVQTGFDQGTLDLIFDHGDSRANEVSDSEWDTERPAGHFEFKDGYILITLTDDYINDLVKDTGTGNMKGTLTFDGTFYRGNQEDGSQNIKIADFEIPVKFTDREPEKPELKNKTGWLTNPSDGTITWQVTVDSKNLDLTDYTLEDNMLKDVTDVEYEPKDYTPILDNGKITFKGIPSSQYVTITYKTPITEYNKNIINTATLKKDNTEDSKQGSVWVGKAVNVTKSGEADYDQDGGTYNKQITWKIKIESQQGQSLDGYIIEDVNFPSDVNEITVTGGSLTKTADGKYKLSTSAKTVELTYTANVSDDQIGDGKKVANDVTVKTPNGEPESSRGEVEYKKISDLYDLTKHGDYNVDTHLIKWTVHVSSTNYKNLLTGNLKLEDAGFANAVDTNGVKFYNTDGTSFTLGEVSGTTMTLSQVGYNSSIEFYYYTKPDKVDTDTDVANKVELKKDNTTVKEETGHTIVKPYRDTLSKSVQGGSKSSSVPSNGTIEQTIHWQAEIVYDDTLAGKQYKDTLSVEGNDATHKLNPNSIKVYAGTTDTGTVLNGDYYSLDATENGFTITFNEKMDEAKYNHVQIKYETTATAGLDYGDYTFKNEGSGFGTGTVGDSYTITRENPVVDEKLDLTVQKEWNNDTESNRPETVQFQVYYQTRVNNAWSGWKPLKGSGNVYCFDGDAGYSTEQNYTVTVGDGNNWQSQLTGLPLKKADVRDDGTQGDVTEYQYKVEETNGSSGSYFTVTGGMYQIGYSDVSDFFDLNHPNRAQTISLTNTFYPNISVKPVKKWTGDDLDGEITEVTMVLMRSTNKWEWKTVLNPITLNGTLTGTNITWNGDQWSDLPQRDASGALYYYKIVETSVKKKDGTTVTIDSNSNKFKIGDVGYFEITKSSDTSDENWTNNTKELEITNKFYKTKQLSIEAKKNWNDSGHENQRPKQIILALQREENGSGNWTTITNGEKRLTPEAAVKGVTWDSQPSQSIDAYCNVTTYRYRVVEVGYVVSVDGEDKEYRIGDSNSTPKFTTSSEGYYEGSYNNNDRTDSGTVEITNTFKPLTTISINPQKKWEGDTDTEATRPTSVTLRLQRQYNGAWTDYKDASDHLVEVTLSSDNNPNTDTWSGTTIENLPKEEINVEITTIDTTYTKKVTTTPIYYRLVEIVDGKVMENGSTFKVGNGGDKYKVTIPEGTNSDGGFTVTNTFEKNIGVEKAVVNDTLTDKSNTLTIEKSDLIAEDSPYKKNIGGTDYYVFNWVIEFDTTGKSSSTYDQLPTGHTLVEDSSPAPSIWEAGGAQTVDFNTLFIGKFDGSCEDGYYYRPFMVYSNKLGADTKGITVPGKMDSANAVIGSTNDSYYYDTDANRVYFSKPSVNPGVVFQICYSTKIPCSELDGSKKIDSIRNCVVKLEDGDNETKDQSIATIEITNPPPSQVINKTYNEGRAIIPGYMSFSLDINPEGMNLSNGDTIDIEDIFKTASYRDSDWENSKKVTQAITSGENLVDVLMNNIDIYEVDVNGNRIPLDKSEYTLKFESSENGVTGQDGENGAALLKLTVPDEMHIAIDYTYKLIANNKTPSVLNGCKSTVRGADGRFKPMESGLVPPPGDVITFSNKAKLRADSASGESKVNNTQFEIRRSGGTISTNRLPKIKKVNVGNYGINDLSAQFLLGRYDDVEKKWYYAKTISADHEITDWTDGIESLTKIANDAIKIDVNTAYAQEVSLSQNSLYKLVEINVPEGYEGSNLGLNPEQFEQLIRNYLNEGNTKLGEKDYAVFLNQYVPTHYFVYNSVMTNYPSGIDKSKVLQVKSGSDVEIPNNELIDISVKKTWVTGTVVDNATIDVELYWSYKKASTGIPEDAKLADATELGMMGTLDAKQTVLAGEVHKLWTDLPNGKNDQPIYYYVKEVSYTIEGQHYVLDADDGKYYAVDNNGEAMLTDDEFSIAGAYYPTYVNNAANTDTTVEVNNSEQLRLKKMWKSSNGDPLAASKIPTDCIKVSVSGVLNDGNATEELLFSDVELCASNDWEADISELLNELPEGKYLSNYKSFTVTEEDGSQDGSFQSDDYVVSCVFNLNEDTGEITVTNKSTKVTDASATVSKIWSDGTEIHAKDSITVSLYQLTENVTDMSQLMQTLSGKTPMKKKGADGQPTNEDETVILNAENNWTYTWTGLPIDNADDEHDATVTYYYYVKEDGIVTSEGSQIDPTKYSAAYKVTKTGTKTTCTITNTRKSINVMKQWLDENGDPILDVYDEDGNLVESNTANLPGIQLKLYKKSAEPLIRDGCHPSPDGYTEIANEYFAAINSYYGDTKPANPLKIVAFGDSITDGYAASEPNCSKNENCYPHKLTDLLKKGGYALSGDEVVNKGNSGEEVGDGFINRVDTDIPTDADIVLLLGGTNDIHHTYNRGFANPTECMKSLENCIKKIQTRAPNAIIIVGSIPHFDFYDASGNLTEGGKWWAEEYRDGRANQLIDQYNEKIAAYAASPDNDKVYYVDTCSAVDGKDYIKGADGSDIITLNASSDRLSNWADTIDVEDGDATYYIEEVNVPSGWTVKGYEPANGLKPGTTGVLTVKNQKNTVPKTNVSVEKTWERDSEDTSKRNKIKLTLMKGIKEVGKDISWTEVDTDMPTAQKNGDIWTYVYNDLPAEDNAGNTYHYKIIEDPLDGYSREYTTETALATSGGTTKLALTNTYKLSLQVEKIWADEADHSGDKITVKVSRSTDQNNLENGWNESDLILEIDRKVTVVEGSSKDITANKQIEIVGIFNPDVAAASLGEDGKTLTIEGKNAGSGTITVTDGIDTYDIEVTVSAYKLLLDNQEDFTITASADTHKLSVEKGNQTVTDGITYESTATDVLTVDEYGNITIHGIGTAKVIVKADDTKILEKDIAVILPPGGFVITGETAVIIGNDIQLGVDPKYGSFTWSSENEAVATVDQTGKVHGVSAGRAVIKVIRNDDGEESTKEITVENGDVWESENLTVKVRIGDSITLTSTTPMTNVHQKNYGSLDHIDCSLSDNVITITGKSEGTEYLEVQGGQNNNEYKYITVIVIDKFTLSPATKTLAYGDSVTLQSNMEGSIHYEIKSGGDLISISGNTVTAKSDKEGTAVIEATLNGETATVTIEVVAEISTISGTIADGHEGGKSYSYEYDQSAGTIVFAGITSSGGYENIHFNGLKTNELLKDLIPCRYTVSPAAFVYGPGQSWSNSQTEFNVPDNTTPFKDFNNGDIGFAAVDPGTYTFTIYVRTDSNYSAPRMQKSGMGLSLTSARSNIEILESTSNDSSTYVQLMSTGLTTRAVNDGTWVGDVTYITLDSTNGFHKILKDLEMCDKNEHPYYYTIEEVELNGKPVSGFTPTYSFSDNDNGTTYCINASQPGDGIMTVRNTKNESDSVELPETGGRGTTIYYTVGGILLLLSAAGYVTFKRRRWFNE